jgi:hypothetical protein
MDALAERHLVLQPTEATRPPCRPPRARSLDPETRHRVERLVRDGLGRSVEVSVTEWVSMDSRAAPHVTRLRVRTADGVRVGSVAEQAALMSPADALRCFDGAARVSAPATGRTPGMPASARDRRSG